MEGVPSLVRDSKCQCYISVSCYTVSLHNKQNRDAILLKSRSDICIAMTFIVWLLHHLASPTGTINCWAEPSWAQNQISIEGICCRRKFPSFQVSSCLREKFACLLWFVWFRKSPFLRRTCTEEILPKDHFHPPVALLSSPATWVEHQQPESLIHLPAKSQMNVDYSVCTDDRIWQYGTIFPNNSSKN